MPAETAQSFTAIVLAAQRGGRLDPLAAEAGVTHKCLVPILGRPLIEYVLEALARVPGVRRIRICIEPDAVEAVRRVPGASGELGIPVDFVPSCETITESVYASAESVEGPLLITTADNVNITPQAVEQVMAPLGRGSDVALAFATREAVLEARAEENRDPASIARVGPYRFADGAYSNCNLYALAGSDVLEAAEAFREGGQFSKSLQRLLRFIGAFNILLYAFKLLPLDKAMKRLSKRLGLRLKAVVLDDGAHAVDVDNARTYRLAEMILRKKAEASA